MGLEEKILDNLAQEMAREIDKELLEDLMTRILVDDGWTATNINPAFADRPMTSGSFNDWYSQTAQWVHLNARGDYKLMKGQWLFEDPLDATMFILRWS
jgi:hypothetical protein